uniref:sialidase family protein n=1 Tax=Tessaracoccus timonensis TaxID=2161816 RepID=UPI00131F030B|nr:sialidase family protein [Tessaracoccus timonensis]
MTAPRLRQFPSLASPTSVTGKRNPLGADLTIAEAPEHRRFHFPGACRLPDGTLLVVARQGKEHVDPTGIIQLVRSTDDGATWSEPVTVWDSDHDDRDPMLSVGPTGSVHLIFFTRTEPQLGDVEAMGVRVMSSDDGGYYWTMPTRLENSRPGWLASHGQVMETANGTLVAPVYGPMWSGISRSLDGGESFPASEQYVFDTFGVATTEVTLTLIDGVLIAWLRPTITGVPSLLFRSYDDGATWDGPEPTSIIQSSAAALPLPDGRLLVAWGDVSRRYDERRVTCVGIVNDPFAPWTDVTPLPIWDALNNDQGNPTLTLLGDGTPLVIVNDYASRQLVGIRMPIAMIDAAVRDEAQLEGAIDLLSMVRDGRAALETNAPEPTEGPAAPERLFDGELGLATALMGADDQTELCATLRFALPLPVHEVGVALRPGEWQNAEVEVERQDGAWHVAGTLKHGWRLGDVDWLALDGGEVQAVRVTSRLNPAERPRWSGEESPTIAISQIALR